MHADSLTHYTHLLSLSKSELRPENESASELFRQ